MKFSLLAAVLAMVTLSSSAVTAGEPKPYPDMPETYPAGIDLPGRPVLSPPKPDLDAFASDVLAGSYGNGTDRVERLTAAGLTTTEVGAVQTLVNKLVAATPQQRTTQHVAGTTHKPSTQHTAQPAPQPSSGVWTGPRPAYYGGGSGCSQQMATVVANAMWARGANNNAVTNMLAIMSRESGCTTTAYNDTDAT